MGSMFESIILGLIQGLTEFLPISSSGHLIIARDLFGWSFDNSLTFDIFLNTATLFAVIYCFWGDIRRIFIDFRTEDPSARSKNLLWGILIATIPAALVGFLYGDQIEATFRSSSFVAWALIAGSVLMLLADKVNHSSITQIPVYEWLKRFVVGLFQCLAFFPGMSRSGSTISGGLLMGFSREEAIRFSFLLYIPISLGAILKSISDFESFDISHIPAFVVALVSGIWAVKFMVRYLSKNSFTPFIIYRIILALAIFTFL